MERRLWRLDPEGEVTEALDPVVMRAQLRTNKVLRGKWHLDRLLGVGGMAAVYSATHRNGTRAAVKMLHPELSTHSHVKARFLKEGYVANKVDHPGVVSVLDDDVDEDGSIYLVMELLDGESLEARRERMGGRLDADEVLSIADQVLDVLAAAHDKGIVHRDIKPDNVFLTRDGVVKVLDFGIARLRELSSTASSATQTGTTMGTPAYMAPEHARGLWDEVDARSDLWSVGAMMFNLVTGRLVHEARTANEQLVAAVTQRASAMVTVAPETPKPLAEVIDKALAYDKADRWADAHAMQEAVRTAYDRMRHAPIASYPPLAVPESVPNRTLASAEVPLPVAPGPSATGPAVVSGRTGVPLTASSSVGLPKSYLVAGGIAAGGAVLALVIVIAAVIGSRASSGDTAASSSAADLAAQPDADEPVAASSDAGPDSTVAEPGLPPASSAPVVSLTDLPTAQAPKPPPQRPGWTAKPPPVPPVSKPKTDWKDQRR